MSDAPRGSTSGRGASPQRVARAGGLGEPRLETLLQNAVDMVAIVDGESRVVYITPSVERFTGYRPEDLVGKVGFDFIHPDDLACVAEVFGEVASTPGHVRTVELRYRDATGEWRWLEAVLSNLLDDPDVGGIVGNFHDTTRDKLLETRVRQAERLQAVKALAEGAAHNFNNLLAVIQNYARFVLDELPEGDAKAADVHEIVEAAERASRLVRQLLLFSREDLTRGVVTDVDTVIRGLSGVLAAAAGPEIEMALHLRPEPWQTVIDAGHLEEVLLNVVANARDAMPDGGRLEIFTSNRSVTEGDAAEHPGLERGEYVVVSIVDTGRGMDADVRKRAFEPFFSTKNRASASGLGLATVYGIAKQWKGYVHLESTPGAGTRVDLYLPRVAGAAVVDRVGAREAT